MSDPSPALRASRAVLRTLLVLNLVFAALFVLLLVLSFVYGD